MTAPAKRTLDRNNIEALHPLTAMQRSLLYASLRSHGHGSDPGFLQVHCTLTGELDETLFGAAWKMVTARHAALRTSVHWKQTDHPLQVVARAIEPDIETADLRDVHAAGRQDHLRQWLEHDRRRGFELDAPPLFRLALFRSGDREWTFVLSCHHVIIDGWSGVVVLREALSLHDQLAAGRAPETRNAPPFANYVGWLNRLDHGAAEQFWRENLKDLDRSTRFIGTRTNAARHAAMLVASQAMDQHATSRLQTVARKERLTLGTLVQMAWAVVMSAYGRNDDVCFGVTVSGRSAPLDGIEEIVGTFTNVLPVRFTIPGEGSVVSACTELQTRLSTLRRFEHTPSDRIQEWSGLNGSQRIFESLVVVENLPDLGSPADGGLALSDLVGGVASNATTTLMVIPGARTEFRLLYNEAAISPDVARRIVNDLVTVLAAMVDHPAESLRTVMRILSGERAEAEARVSDVTHDSPPSNGEAALVPVSSDPLEFQLAQLFENVLGVPAVGVHDDFFDRGGHSLVALQLFDRMEKVFGRRLPLATLFEASTPHALATRLEADGWRAPWSSLVAMQPAGDTLPLFCIHSYEGHILHYRDLAMRLAPDQPVYGLQSIGLNGARQPYTTVQEMAAAYLADMRSVQPAGPYSIAAICFGIAVAFEIAQVLIAEGEEVARLFILDSAFHHLLPIEPQPDASLIERSSRRVAARAQGLAARTSRLVASLRETENERNARFVREANEQAWRAYRPRPYPGTITLIRSAGYAARQDWHVEMWSGLGQALETHILPGDHRNFIREPNAPHVARCIRACLAASVPA